MGQIIYDTRQPAKTAQLGRRREVLPGGVQMLLHGPLAFIQRFMRLQQLHEVREKFGLPIFQPGPYLGSFLGSCVFH